MSGVISYSLYEFSNVGRYRIFKQNRIISISSRLIEFWCFALPAALGVGQVGGWGWWVVGGTPTHMHMHADMHMHIYTLNMIISIANGSPHWGNPWEFPMMSHVHVHVCPCMHACAYAHVWGAPPDHSPPPSPPSIHPTGGTPGISQNTIALELIKIFQFRLKI